METEIGKILRRIYEGSGIMKVREYERELNSIEMYEKPGIGKGNHRFFEHKDHSKVYTTVSGKDGQISDLE